MAFRYTMGVVVFCAVLAFLFHAREAVRMFVIAAFSAYLISPATVFLMERTRLSRAAAVNIVYFTALIVLVGIPAALTPIFFDEIKLVAQDILDLTATLSGFLSEPIQLGGFVLHLEQLGESLAHFQEDALSPLPSEALELLEATSINILWLLIVLVTVHLIMSEWPRMRKWLFELAPPEYQGDMHELYKRLRNVWMAYLRGQIVLMVVVGIVFTIAWAAIGIPPIAAGMRQGEMIEWGDGHRGSEDGLAGDATAGRTTEDTALVPVGGSRRVIIDSRNRRDA